jgi:hypothetical protein
MSSRVSGLMAYMLLPLVSCSRIRKAAICFCSLINEETG